MGVVVIQPFQRRLAELFKIMQKRKLSDQEAVEMHHCLAANAKFCWEIACLENLSLLAAETNDIEWQHEIARRWDEVVYGRKKKKKPGKKPDQK